MATVSVRLGLLKVIFDQDAQGNLNVAPRRGWVWPWPALAVRPRRRLYLRAES